MLLNTIEPAMSGPLITAINSIGKLKKYQIITSFIIFANLPLSFLFLLVGFSPTWVIIISISLNIISIIWRIIFLYNKIKFPILRYLYDVIFPILIISICSVMLTYISYIFFIDWIRLLITCIVSTISIILLVYLFGLKTQERILFKNYIFKLLKRKA
jgi:membrane protease YdiL (CAAX protease family)